MNRLLAQLVSALRPIRFSELRSELQAMQRGETFMLTLEGKQFVVMDGCDWAELAETATDRNGGSLVPSEFDQN